MGVNISGQLSITLRSGFKLLITEMPNSVIISHQAADDRFDVVHYDYGEHEYKTLAKDVFEIDIRPIIKVKL